MIDAARPRPPRRALHGVLLVDKPLGWTSHDALAKAKGLLRAAKGGHTGTLDPLATGLLPLAFGAATKFAQANLDADKRYRATLRLGERTRSGDGEGEVVERREVACSAADIAAVLARFTGEIDQVPPRCSLIWLNSSLGTGVTTSSVTFTPDHASIADSMAITAIR